MKKSTKKTIACLLFQLPVLALVSTPTYAALTYWTDWTTSSGTPNTLNSPFTAQGVITTSGSTVNVTYSNPNGFALYQPSGGIDYWANGASGVNGRNDATSPYTSALVDNAPTGTDIILLRYAGQQTLSFDQAIANPVFSYLSLNGNGYGFDRDFDILSVGAASDGNDIGYYGTGTASKNVVDLGGGVMQYQLLGTGENSGTIRFTGAFNSVTWNSLSNENWNGFTLGVQGTAAEVPEPTTVSLLGLALTGFYFMRRKKLS